MAAIRKLLDGLYLAGGILGALSLVIILILVVLQMVARWSGEVAPGIPEYAGYFMASSAFLAFAYALNKGAHIRVGLLLQALGDKRKWLEIWCFAIGSGLAIYFSYYAIKAVYWSQKLNDISQGQDATPLWIPQLSMAVGAVLLAIAMLDHLVQLIFTGEHGIDSDALESHAE
ncbi:TRAP transporter small permease [Cohaesibacter gelatinilyticus]|uniref:TRAP transporter small permease protein n=1 Tax=Cohaesibacter gelatinilyticus TaxID=372072 RepID=A0A285ND85_9HYPH|nr:TRAP transporter small permease [Cohaesibacter gelatinilyticus]SNZ06917.1 TRAP-type C4-dicarboxylate transport system, small permease component [Cohaesibacter gelatinilyticus]HAT85839.1 TRAP transporter small permease [Hyphomicrobiales bacterium]